jgi:hypothetical protein
MGRTVILNVAVVTALCGVAAQAAGQTLALTEPRRTPGLFSREPARDQSLDLNVLVLGAYDDNLITESGAPSDPRIQKSGSYNGLLTNAGYTKRSRHAELGISGRSALRYYPALHDVVSAQHAMSAGLSVHAGGTEIHGTQTYAYSPFFSIVDGLALFQPDVAPLPSGATVDEALVQRDVRTSSSAVSVARELGRRISMSVLAAYQHTVFADDGATSTTRLAGGSLSRKLTRDVSLVAGYSYQEALYRTSETGADRAGRLHTIDAGVDFSRPLGPTRRTTVGFTTGSTIVQDRTYESHIRMIGHARLNREIGRTWHVTGAYRRAAGFVDGFPQPFFADSVAIDIGGHAARRVDLSMGGGFSMGDMGFLTGTSSTEKIGTSARVRVALNRSAAVSSEYMFYRYRFDDLLVLPAGVPPKLHRQGIRIGLDLWLPLVR